LRRASAFRRPLTLPEHAGRVNGEVSQTGRPDYPCSMAIRVLLADDSALVREGVRLLLQSQPDLHLVGVCEDETTLLAAVDAERPDVVVTDVRMPPTGTDEGIRAARWLREHHPEVGVVVLSQHVEPEYATALFEGGSEGRAYLLKERVGDVEELRAAIRAVHRGGTAVGPKVVEALLVTRTGTLLDRLTPREHEVLAEIAKGKNNPAIAETLYMSAGGAREAHRFHLLQAGAHRGADVPPSGACRPDVPRGGRQGLTASWAARPSGASEGRKRRASAAALRPSYPVAASTGR
jgi:DNA-binding NarL/FixJ family response regulator